MCDTIRTAREVSNLDAEDITQNCNVSHSTIRNIETNQHLPSLTTVYELCVLFECEITDLLPTVAQYKKMK